MLADIFSYRVNTGSSIAQVLTTKYQYFLPLAEEIALRRASMKSARKRRTRWTLTIFFPRLWSFSAQRMMSPPYQEKFEHVLVDEYQDTNHLQAELVGLIASRHGNIMVVGDDAQSIYSWRGADFDNILRFPEKHPEAQILRSRRITAAFPRSPRGSPMRPFRGTRSSLGKTLVAARAPHALRPAVVSLATNSPSRHGVCCSASPRVA